MIRTYNSAKKLLERGKANSFTMENGLTLRMHDDGSIGTPDTYIDKDDIVHINRRYKHYALEVFGVPFKATTVKFTQIYFNGKDHPHFLYGVTADGKMAPIKSGTMIKDGFVINPEPVYVISDADLKACRKKATDTIQTAFPLASTMSMDAAMQLLKQDPNNLIASMARRLRQGESPARVKKETRESLLRDLTNNTPKTQLWEYWA